MSLSFNLSPALVERVQGFAQHAGETVDDVVQRLVMEGLEYELWLREQIAEGDISLATEPTVSLEQLEVSIDAILAGTH